MFTGGRKDSVIGTSDHLRAGENHLDRDRSKQQCRIRAARRL
ncbi:hypothetical protein OIU79_020344 [Salix purpurea]|uniref:Uncharacterized protein n=1 Tax=Salix purpurea TaxID=77065 RepID=A0A9Q0NU97_SALPP|nr:hypothetical protein OIU79_020344 [Salix purpurea]